MKQPLARAELRDDWPLRPATSSSVRNPVRSRIIQGQVDQHAAIHREGPMREKATLVHHVDKLDGRGLEKER